MGAVTKIQWCHHTFNPWRGCTKIAPGCENCYAERESKRFPKVRGVWGPKGTRVMAAAAAWREPIAWNAAAEAAGERRRVFCASLADVFEDWPGRIHDHEGRALYRCSQCGQNWTHDAKKAELCDCVSMRDDWRDYRHHPINWLTLNEVRRELFALIDRTPFLDWLLVTKRPERIGECWYPIIKQNAHGAEVHDHADLFRPNAWLLGSASDQATAELMTIRLLTWRACSPILGLSFEPMLGPVDFNAFGNAQWNFNGLTGLRENPFGDVVTREDGPALDWIIFGGESGSNARPCNLQWIADALGQCHEAHVPAFVKQAGSFPLVPSLSSMEAWALRREHLVHGVPHTLPGPGNLIEVHLKHPKGGDLAELPAELQVREFPAVALEGAAV